MGDRRSENDGHPVDHLRVSVAEMLGNRDARAKLARVVVAPTNDAPCLKQGAVMVGRARGDLHDADGVQGCREGDERRGVHVDEDKVVAPAKLADIISLETYIILNEH